MINRCVTRGSAPDNETSSMRIMPCLSEISPNPSTKNSGIASIGESRHEKSGRAFAQPPNGVFQSADASDVAVVIDAGPVDPDREGRCLEIAVPVRRSGDKIQFLIRRGLGLTEREAADIEGIVVVARNAVRV